MQRIILYGALTVLLAGSVAFLGLSPPAAMAKGADGGGGGNGLASLKTVPVPKPTNLATYVKSEAAAVKLGKALFWDMQAGGDGRQSCASCHSAAGADNRIRNTVNPHGVAIPPWVANAMLTLDKFPITDQRVVGSAGVIQRAFASLDNSGGAFPSDNSVAVTNPDPAFILNGHQLRRVTGRQTPSVINSVYNFRFFWDGRARETFNGVSPGGATTDPAIFVLKVASTGRPNPVQISIDNASAASQAVGPANNGTEMSWDGRSFLQLGKKMLRQVPMPLAAQMVASDDSVLGAYSNAPGRGLNIKYAQMVEDAFQDVWWNSNSCVDGNKHVFNDTGNGCPNSYTVKEANFSLFWGLAIQLYEATLIANDTPFDKGTLTVEQLRGLQVFTNEGRCVQCHKGAELTKASVRSVLSELPFNPATGFFNTGQRPDAEDGGIQDVGIANRAMFKTPHLRNVELTGPYFHNGSQATLRDVVDSYNRGNDHRSNFTDSQIRPLNLSEAQKSDLVHFLMGLTDERVRYEKAPFDHPSLLIHNGVDATGVDIDNEIILPAVGAGGRGLSNALPAFLNLTNFEQLKPSPIQR